MLRLTPQQVLSIIEQLNGHHKLIVSLLYGSGLRISECLRLRLQMAAISEPYKNCLGIMMFPLRKYTPMLLASITLAQ